MSAPVLHYFEDSAAFALELARETHLEALPVEQHVFPDGETLVRSARTGTHAILVRSLHNPNAKLVEVLLAADALRRAGAMHLTLVAPYLPYMRQDTVFNAGEPNSQIVVGAILSSAFDTVLTVEAHLHRIGALSEVYGENSLSISAAPAIARWVQRHAQETVVVGPDAESFTWASSIAKVAHVPYVVATKHRGGDRCVSVTLPPLPEIPQAVIVDDIASTGATLAATARALREHGIRKVYAAVVHAIFAPGAEARIRDGGIGQLVSCDTVPHESNAISVAELVALELRKGE